MGELTGTWTIAAVDRGGGRGRRPRRARVDRAGASRRHGSRVLRHLRRRRPAQDAVQAAWPRCLAPSWGRCVTRRGCGRGSSASPRTKRDTAAPPFRPRDRAGDRRGRGERSRTRPTNAALLDLADAMRRLSADDRALLALRYVADFDSTELGRALGMSPSACGRGSPGCSLAFDRSSTMTDATFEGRLGSLLVAYAEGWRSADRRRRRSPRATIQTGRPRSLRRAVARRCPRGGCAVTPRLAPARRRSRCWRSRSPWWSSGARPRCRPKLADRPAPTAQRSRPLRLPRLLGSPRRRVAPPSARAHRLHPSRRRLRRRQRWLGSGQGPRRPGDRLHERPLA